MTAAVRRRARRLALLRYELLVAIRRAELDAERVAATLLEPPAGTSRKHAGRLTETAGP